jgi:hypothetical protein
MSVREKKKQKKGANTSALLSGWERLAWISLRDCDSFVPRNAIYALRKHQPNATIPMRITYGELYELMEGL